jgi:thiamine-phosphate diphosphorylase
LKSKPTPRQAPKPFQFPAALYPIIDTLGDANRSYLDLAYAIVAAGVPLVQLRVKAKPTRDFIDLAQAVKEMCDARGTLLIVNDRVDIAKLVDAGGVHVGQDDVPAQAARAVLGPGKIIGVSTHNLEQAERAAREGVADYIGCGPIFATASKADAEPVLGVDGLRRVRQRVGLPIVGIGGIGIAAARSVLLAGADAVAMISEIVRSQDVTAQVRAILASLDSRGPREATPP